MSLRLAPARDEWAPAFYKNQGSAYSMQGGQAIILQ